MVNSYLCSRDSTIHHSYIIHQFLPKLKEKLTLDGKKEKGNDPTLLTKGGKPWIFLKSKFRLFELFGPKLANLT